MPCRAGHSHPAAPEQILLDAAPADIERVTSETNDMEGIHDRRRVGEFFGRSGPEPCEPIHPDHRNPLAPFPGPFSEPLPEHGPRPALDHVQQPGGARLGADWGEVDDHGDVVVTEPRVTTDMLVDTDRGGPRTWPGRRSAAACLPRARRRSPRSTTPRDLPRGELVDDDPPQHPRHAEARGLRPRRQAELVEAAERGQVRDRERRVVHVEVFRRMGSVGTSILEDLDLYLRTGRRPSPTPSTAKSHITRKLSYALLNPSS